MQPQPARIVLYLNQFFGQIGGEEAAGVAPSLSLEPVGSARALAAQIAPGETLAGVLVCGDNHFAEHSEQATRELLDLIRPLAPTMFLAGPAYNSGRYGVACGALCQAVGAELHVPTVTGMFRENPGVDLYRRATVVLETGDNARTMAQDLGRMLAVARLLQRGESLGRPHDVGYFSHGIVAQEQADRPAATRAVDMLLGKLGGQPYYTEVELPTFTPVRAAAPVANLREATVALVTDGGLVPAGNPDGIESRAATKFGIYPIEGRDRLDPADYDVSHGGYDTGFVKIDPHRLIPLDVAREIEHEGLIGHLFQNFLATTGLANPLENSRRLGREMADYLREAGVDAVILTSTWGTSTRCGAAIATELEAAGLPTAQICTMTPVAEMVGTPRIVPGNGIVHPTGDAERSPEEEHQIRRRLLQEALAALASRVGNDEPVTAP